MNQPQKAPTNGVGRIILIGLAVTLGLGLLRYIGYSPAQVATGTGKAAQPAAPAIVDPFAPAASDTPPRPELTVARTVLGNCPTGYVDHPMNPKLCALPAFAERMLARARNR